MPERPCSDAYDERDEEERQHWSRRRRANSGGIRRKAACRMMLAHGCDMLPPCPTRLSPPSAQPLASTTFGARPQQLHAMILRSCRIALLSSAACMRGERDHDGLIG